MTDDLVFRDDMTVTLVKSSASDSDVVWAARVSTQGERSLDAVEDDPEKAEGLIRYLMKNRHSSPLEHSSFTFYVECPIFVVREIHRHRLASYNEWSGRYAELKPVFYVPNDERKIIQTGKAGHYQYVPGTSGQVELVQNAIIHNSFETYKMYKTLLDSNIAREVARMVLPLNIYTSFYMTINARSLMNFISLRTKRDDSRYPSFPQREVEMVAEKVEELFAEKMPIVYKYFNEFGRVSP